jgi:predicted TIM-barrel fold metal-dependent hydrolase
MSIEKMEQARRIGEALCGDGRVLLQGEAFPQVGELGATLDGMTTRNAEHRLVAWKTYTHVGGGYTFLDERGTAFLDHVAELAATAGGPSVVCVHKGFGADPADVGPAAAAHPDVTFCVYHSGFEPGSNAPAGGVERFVQSLAGAGNPTNVYAELGSTWRTVLADPDRAAHVLGSLLLAVGPERILWGTDSVWYGSPQDQIEAFRAFEITPQAQEQFGYPALTPDMKRLIFGANAAALHGLDLAAVERPCRDVAEQEEAIGRLGGQTGPRGPVSRRDVLALWQREHPWF